MDARVKSRTHGSRAHWNGIWPIHGRSHFVALLAVCFGYVVCGAEPARAETCARGDFEAVVDQASQTLVDMTRQNTPTFQAKLRTLRDKRRWTQDQFMTLGAAFVRDDQITAYDELSEQLLIRINTQAGGTADCRILAELKSAMAKLVETQNTKWSYMFGKIDQELAK